MRIVISQSMLFPWVGLLEQVRLADIFVHYNDVQFSKGSFVNRVQLKSPGGPKWLTIPTQNLHLGQKIADVQASAKLDWRTAHRGLVADCLGEAPHASDATMLLESVYSRAHSSVGDIARESLMALVRYFELDNGRQFMDSAELGIAGSNDERVLHIVKSLGGTEYITGHGASRYLDHAMFETNGVQVRYMRYRMKPYPQLHGAFTPFVSALDLVANCGRAGSQYICSDTVSWREFTQ